MRWILTELPNLDTKVRAAILGQFVALRDGLVGVFTPVLPSEEHASNLAWLLICLGIGYQQLFCDPVFSQQVVIEPQDLVNVLVNLST